MITKKMKLNYIIEKYPDTINVFFKYGLGCIGCSYASFETIEEGCKAHNIDVDKLVKELNKGVKDDSKGKSK